MFHLEVIAVSVCSKMVMEGGRENLNIATRSHGQVVLGYHGFEDTLALVRE